MALSTRAEEKKCVTLKPPYFNVHVTLSSGQTFRWERIGADIWMGIVRASVIRVRQAQGILEVQFESRSDAEKWSVGRIREYFDLDADYAKRCARLGRHAGLGAILDFYGGLHILHQEPFEVLISFIISAFNNILRIKECIRKLARAYGDPIGERGQDFAFSFPSPGALAAASESELRACGLGYRARYVQESAARVLEMGEAFKSLDRLSTCELRQELTWFPGVGSKVAECILLFGYQRLEAFPIDVWVRRAMRQLFFHGRPIKDRRISIRALREFGADAGLAQQYLFTGFRAKRGAFRDVQRRSLNAASHLRP